MSGQEIHPALGYITGWSMVMDYLLNPLICTAFSAKAAMNIVPGPALLCLAGGLRRLLHLGQSARHQDFGAAERNPVRRDDPGGRLFFGAVVNVLWRVHHDPGFFLQAFL